MSEKSLNKEQLEAVIHKNGPLMIVAGAGTGKTTVITERVSHIIKKGWALPSEILCLTFTEKAALEMETRIDEALPLGYTQMWVTTFHSFCDRILKESAIHIGLDPKYKLLTTSESIDLLRTNIFDLGLNYFRPLGNPNKFLFGLISHFSRLQDENISPDEYFNWGELQTKNQKLKDESEILNSQKWKELSTAYKKYNELKIRNSYMDFGDLITNTIKLFTLRPNILKEYQNKFKFILVDEFQDTNYAQNELVKLLAGENGNITVVLDDDQSIYRFRGASVSNALQFRSSFKNTKVVTLIQNYRSLQGILDKAHLLINHNNPDRLEVIEKINKKLIANRVGLADVSFSFLNTNIDEANYVSNKILNLTNEEGMKFSDIAILVRANNHADSFINSFNENNIPYQFLGPGKLFEQEEILDLINYLKVLDNIEDDQSLYAVLSNSIFLIDFLDIARISAYARKNSKSIFESCLDIDLVGVSDDSKEKLNKVLKKITNDLSLITKKNVGEILYSFVEDTNIIKKLLESEKEEDIVKLENITKFFGKVKAYELSKKKTEVRDFIKWIDLQVEMGESPLSAELDWEGNDSVKVLTVHSSKGLEFPVVFLVNLVGQRFPSMNRQEQIPIPEALVKETLPTGDFHLQEERRLFYVGMTRAKDRLYLTAAKYYGDAVREKKISPFVYESGIQTVKFEDSNSYEKVIIPDEKILTSKTKLKVNYLSYSQIETFKLCELHYKLRYILKIPTAPTPAQSFGNSFHRTLKDFYLRISEGQKPTKELIISLLTENWIREGYSNKKHNEESFKKAKEYLFFFLENYFNEKVHNLGVEIPFNFKINDLKIGGIIDRVDKDNDAIHIVDYKTGEKALTQKEADKNLQLSIYALAATSILEQPFGYSPDKIKLSLIYFHDPQIITTYRTQKQLDDAKEEILSWREKIEESDFKCTNDFFCSGCEYKLFCGKEIKD